MRILALVAAALAALGGIAHAAGPPSALTGPASAVGETSATLTATVNPNGSSTTYYFQWGLTAAYGANSAAHSAGAGSHDVTVHTTASSLQPATTYHYRIVALNGAGTTYGTDATFTTVTPPTVQTGAPARVTTSSATVTGVVDPRGGETSWSFEYGLTSHYGVFTYSDMLAAASASLPVAVTLRGLAAGTIFHYRLVARHRASGSVTTYGADQTFMTYPARRPVPRLSLRTRRPRPGQLAVSGTVQHPMWIPSPFACGSGKVVVATFLGARRTHRTAVPLAPDCTFGAQFTGVHPPAPFRLVVRFVGNGYLAEASAPPRLLSP